MFTARMAFKGQHMNSPAPRRRTSFLVPAAATLLALACIAQAQQPEAGTTAASPAKKAPPKAGASASAAAAPSEKAATSYSLGVMMGEQLRDGGVSPESVDSARVAQGVRDALSGKHEVTDADRQNMVNFLRSAQANMVENNHHAAAAFLAENGKKPGIVTTASGLQYKVIAPGSGESPKATDKVTVNYRGTLLNGTEFDSSYKRGEPASFGVSQVIPGWTEALQLMKPGGKMKLYIPPQLAYDVRSRPPIPPGSMLIFDVELLSIAPAPAPGAAAQPAPAQPK
jgi:FKBP-type peptidyl-prolyl cis-trans isomerase